MKSVFRIYVYEEGILYIYFFYGIWFKLVDEFRVLIILFAVLISFSQNYAMWPKSIIDSKYVNERYFIRIRSGIYQSAILVKIVCACHRNTPWNMTFALFVSSACITFYHVYCCMATICNLFVHHPNLSTWFVLVYSNYTFCCQHDTLSCESCRQICRKYSTEGSCVLQIHQTVQMSVDDRRKRSNWQSYIYTAHKRIQYGRGP